MLAADLGCSGSTRSILRPYGVLIFKWSEDQISTVDVLKLLPVQPLFGNRRGKTIWMVFMKFPIAGDGKMM